MTHRVARSAPHHDGWRDHHGWRDHRGWGARAFLAGITVAAFCVLGVVFGAPALAASPSITVSPSTGLSDGQTVTVHGTGYTPNVHTINVVECPVSGASQNACDLTGGDAQLLQPADASGSFTVHMPVRAKLGSVNCGVAACMIVAHEGISQTSGNNAQQILQFGPTETGSPISPTSTAPGTPGSGSSTSSGSSGGAGGGASPSTPAAGGPTGANTGHIDLGAPRIALSLWLAAGGLALLALGTVVHLRRTRSAR
jgi:hypothetical protein